MLRRRLACKMAGCHSEAAHIATLAVTIPRRPAVDAPPPLFLPRLPKTLESPYMTPTQAQALATKHYSECSGKSGHRPIVSWRGQAPPWHA